MYKNTILQNSYVADFIVFNSIILKIKCAQAIIDAQMAQPISYLNVPGCKLRIIVNFCERLLIWKRVVL